MINYLFLQAAFVDHCTGLMSFSIIRMFVVSQSWIGCEQPVQSWMQSEFNGETVGCWKLQIGNEGACFASGEAKVRRAYKILHGLLIKTILCKLEEAQMFFFIHQAPPLQRRLNSQSSSCWGHSIGSMVLLQWERGECEFGLWIRRTSILEARARKSKSLVHVHVQCAQWI